MTSGTRCDLRFDPFDSSLRASLRANPELVEWVGVWDLGFTCRYFRCKAPDELREILGAVDVHDEVVVVGHDDPVEQADLEPRRVFLEQVEEAGFVAIGFENPDPVDAAVEDVVDAGGQG
jgi:hypothetical protein